MTNMVLLKRSLLAFWAVWLSVVLLSNVADAAKELGLLDESWLFASGNFRFLAATTARYGNLVVINALLFGGVILWEGLAALLFWRAMWTYRGKNTGRNDLYRAFTTSLSLWAAFVLADEICIAYGLESTHLRLFVSHLLTLIAIELLPDE